jgi:diacylglycerol kinase
MKAFLFAISVIIKVIKHERNFSIHLIALFLVTAAGYYFNISPAEWIMVIFAAALVMVTEMINSAVEYLCDYTSPQHNEKIKAVKDIAAGAVLLSAIAALIIGLIIFIPYFSDFLK